METRDFSMMFEWLIAQYPGDVLTQRSTHDADLIHWEDYRFCMMSLCTSHVDLYLRDICVIDFTDKAVHDAFRARFPILDAAPCLNLRSVYATAFGAAYFFERSPEADSMGFFGDGEPRIQGVDLLTRCSPNSESPPSIMRLPYRDYLYGTRDALEWSRAPWNGGRVATLPLIPIEVLDALLVPM